MRTPRACIAAARDLSGGVTLIELLVVVAVLALLASLGMPFAASTLESQRLSRFSNQFLLVLQRARSEAIKRNNRVAVCKSATGQACSSSGGWEQGWILFEDSNNNAAVDPGEEIISRGDALTGGLRLYGNSPVDDYVSYSPQGRPRTISGALQFGTIRLCVPGKTAQREIVISSGGRVRVGKASQPCA